MEWEAPSPDFGFLPDGELMEKKGLPKGRAFLRKDLKREARKVDGLKELSRILPEIPAPGCQVHILGNGKYDAFNWVAHLCRLAGEPARGLFSTWTMSRGNALDLLELYDGGQLTEITMLTGVYFKRRETAVYATLTEGLAARGQRYKAFLNHAKLMLLQAGPHFLTVEGSANFTSNPRWEQYVITNDEGLFRFHEEWIEALGWADG